MKAVLLVTTMLLLGGLTIVAAAPTAAACTPPNCPGNGCHLRSGDPYVDPETLEVGGLPRVECYY